jgi:NitT/TauT family transport system substrate-binding protein
LAASQKGWIEAVKDPNGAVDAVMKRVDAATTNRDHQVTMMQEVAKLVMPEGLEEGKVGFIDEQKFKTTADIALKFNVISKPAENAYTNELVEEAVKIKK